MSEGCWDDWFDGLGAALRGTGSTPERRVLDAEAIGPHPCEVTAVVPTVWLPMPGVVEEDDE